MNRAQDITQTAVFYALILLLECVLAARLVSHGSRRRTVTVVAVANIASAIFMEVFFYAAVLVRLTFPSPVYGILFFLLATIVTEMPFYIIFLGYSFSKSLKFSGILNIFSFFGTMLLNLAWFGLRPYIDPNYRSFTFPTP